MNRQLTSAERATIEAAYPVIEATPPLNKQAKLLRLADLVERAGLNIHIFSNVEYMTDERKRCESHPHSAFALALGDATFRQDGLKGDSIADGQRYFEMSNEELHIMSCDCGGAITNTTMANRLRVLAGQYPAP